MRAASASGKGERCRILSVKIRTQPDVVVARQRARQLATLLGFSLSDQAALATAVSEIARNALQHAGEGVVAFEASPNTNPPFLWVEVTDNGPGIPDVPAVLGGAGSGSGLIATRRLTDKLEITSSEKGTRVLLGKAFPFSSKAITAGTLAEISGKLVQANRADPQDEFQEQGRELIRVLEALRERESELAARNIELGRLNLELEETNRGVVALYGELEERAAELRRANELKSQFLSHVSHEFRTPLNSISALTQLLLRRTDGVLTSEQEKQVSFIRQAAEGLVEIVNDLLDLAKVEAGKTEVRNSQVEVSQIFGAIRALMRPLATNDDVALIFEEPSPRLTIETDEAKLGQILRNLVSNALKYTERGEVRISASLIHDGGAITFSVSDTGIGITPEDRELVFKEFSQVHHSMQQRVKGTGLGLSLSRKLATLLGGSLELTSEVGVGSTFILTLPVQPGAPFTAAPAGAPSVEGKAATVLIVDDEETSRYIARRLFPDALYRIVESNGPEAAERARFERPDLIILDLIMPGRTGFEVMDELKGNPETRDIPVVIHTSKSITSADLQRLGGRHLALLPKAGAGRKMAFEAIRKALSNERLFSEQPEFAHRRKDEA